MLQVNPEATASGTIRKGVDENVDGLSLSFSCLGVGFSVGSGGSNEVGGFGTYHSVKFGTRPTSEHKILTFSSDAINVPWGWTWDTDTESKTVNAGDWTATDAETIYTVGTTERIVYTGVGAAASTTEQWVWSSGVTVYSSSGTTGSDALDVEEEDGVFEIQ